MSKSVGTLKVSFNVDSGSLKSGLSKAQGSFKSFSSSLNRLSIGLGIAVSAPLVLIGKEAVKLATELEKQYIKIGHLAGVAANDLGKIKSGISGLSNQLGVSQLELTKGSYMAASGGIRDAASNLSIAEQAAKGFALGLGDVGDISKLVTGVINVYGKQTYTAERVTEMLFNTVKEGQMEVSSLTNTLGRVTSLAYNTGVSFEEMAANIAAFTRGGVNTEEAVTGIRNVLKSLEAPTAKFVNELRAAGTTIEEVQASIRDNGLAQTLINLVDTMRSTGGSVNDLFGNIRGLNDVLGVTGNQSKKYLEIVKKLTSEHGNLERAFSNYQTTTAYKLEQSRIAFENLKIEIGERLFPVVRILTDILRGLIEKFNSLTESQKNTVIQIGLLVAALPLLTTALNAIGTVLLNVVAPAFMAALKGLGSFLALTAPAQAGVLAIAGAAFLVWVYWDDVVSLIREAVKLWEDLSSWVIKVTTISSNDKGFSGYLQMQIDALTLQAKAIKEFFSGNINTAADLWGAGIGLSIGDKSVYSKMSEEFNNSGKESGNAFWEGLKDGLAKRGKDVEEAWQRTTKWFTKNIFDPKDIEFNIVGFLDKLTKGIQKAAPTVKDTAAVSASASVPVTKVDVAALTGFPKSEWSARINKLRLEQDTISSEIDSLVNKLKDDVFASDKMSKVEREFINNKIATLDKLRNSYGGLIEAITTGTETTDVGEAIQMFLGKIPVYEDQIDALVALFKELNVEFEKLNIRASEIDISGIQKFMDQWKKFKSLFGQGSQDIFSSMFVGLNKLSGFWSKWGEEIEGVMGLLNGLGNLISQIYDNRIAKIEESYQSEIDAINGGRMSEKKKADAIAKIEKEKEEKIAKEKRRQAIFSKALSIVDIIVGTAASVAKAGEPILAAINAATGAIALATAIATPIPKYAKGGIFYGRSIGEIGEYAGARHNPEVVSPLSDLRKLLGGSDVYVRGEIDGYKLAIVQQNAAQRYKRL